MRPSANKISTNFVLIFFSLFSLLSIASCSNSDTSNSNVNSSAANQKGNANTLAVKDDVAELSNLINFPQQPEEVVWREENVDQKGEKLTAILKYGNESLSKIVASAEKNKPASPVEVGVEDWFPEELTAQSQLSGNESLKGSVYAANDFFNQPYTNGKLIRIQDTNYIVLELATY